MTQVGPNADSTYPQVDGYTCPACLAWVSYGCSHFCSGQPWIQPPPVKWGQATDVRIADALERIAAALEAAAA